MSKRIIIVVSGGLVRSVYSDVEDVHVSVLDYDSMAACDLNNDYQKEEYEGYQAMERAIETLPEVMNGTRVMEDKRGGREGTVLENSGMNCIIKWDKGATETVHKSTIRIMGYDPRAGSMKGVMHFG